MPKKCTISYLFLLHVETSDGTCAHYLKYTLNYTPEGTKTEYFE